MPLEASASTTLFLSPCPWIPSLLFIFPYRLFHFRPLAAVHLRILPHHTITPSPTLHVLPLPPCGGPSVCRRIIARVRLRDGKCHGADWVVCSCMHAGKGGWGKGREVRCVHVESWVRGMRCLGMTGLASWLEWFGLTGLAGGGGEGLYDGDGGGLMTGNAMRAFLAATRICLSSRTRAVLLP